MEKVVPPPTAVFVKVDPAGGSVYRRGSPPLSNCPVWSENPYPNLRGSILTHTAVELRSEDEVLVFLVAQEAFHYLRRTRQVVGRHGEIEADAFALKTLERYRDESHAALPSARHRGQANR